MEDYFDRPWRDLIGRVAERDGMPLRRGMRARTSTDSVVLSRMGVPTATLVAINRYKALSNYHRMTDTPENICWPTVACAADLAEASPASLRRRGRSGGDSARLGSMADVGREAACRWS